MNPLKTRLAIGGQKGHACRQAGFAPAIILITLAAVFVIGAIFYGFWSSTSSKPTPQVPVPQAVSRSIIQPDNPECPDTDYTGCDTSSDFMTWQDDGVRNPPDSSNSTIFSK